MSQIFQRFKARRRKRGAISLPLILMVSVIGTYNYLFRRALHEVLPLPGPGANLHSVHSATVTAFEQREAFTCDGLVVASAYFEHEGEVLKVHMATGYKPWQSYTPFGPRTIRCSCSSQIGSYLETYKHYSHCTIPYKDSVDDQTLTIVLKGTFDVTTCSIVALPLGKRVATPTYALSALTTVQDSVSYFREWFNFGICTGWSHFYVYDDGSNQEMQLLLRSLIGSGRLTYTNWSHVGHHGSRQFMAMQDFLIRFRHETTYVAQVDDDCYYVSRNPSGRLSTNFANAVYDYFKKSAADVCQLQTGSYWFGHGGIKWRTEPMTLSSFLRANTSLSSPSILWQDAYGEERFLDATLSIAKSKDIFAASGITHRWDMIDTCRTKPVEPPDALYFAHYKMKPLYERSNSTNKRASWGHYQFNEKFWYKSASFLHQIEDRTMWELDDQLDLASKLKITDINMLLSECVPK